MIALINTELRIALEVKASLEAANSLIRGELLGKHYDGASCFTSIQGSQSMFLALTLAKLFEMPKRKRGETYARRYNRSDAASIPLLIRLLKQRRARTVLQERARRWTPQMRTLSETHARNCEAAIEAAIAAYNSLSRTGAGRGALLRLRAFRNKILAHLLLNASRRIRPTYSQLFLLLDAARNVTGHALLAIDGLNVDFKDVEKQRERRSMAFWKTALTAVTTGQR
jgi:hypothetical protein